MDRTPADPSQEGEVEPKKVLKKVQQRANQRQKKKFLYVFCVRKYFYNEKKQITVLTCMLAWGYN